MMIGDSVKYVKGIKEGMCSKRHIYKQLIGCNGLLIQQLVAIEELGELQKEIIKDIRGEGNLNHLIEEIADAEIVIEQIKSYYNLEDQVKEEKYNKIKRIIREYPINMEG